MVHEADIPKTTSRTWYEHFDFTIMLFGLTNAPAVYMDLMNRVCKLYLDKFGIVFIDDILIYSKSKEDHELEEVLFLGHVVNNNDIHVDSSKIKAMKNWKVPKTPSEIRSFLGLTVYCDMSNQELGYVLMQRGKTWRHYLYGTKVVIYTDHKSFQHIFVQKELNMRQQRWIELFSDYDCEIYYHPIKANIVADAFNKILTAQGEASKVGNATAEMLRGLDQQMEKKEDGGLYFIDRGWDSIDRLKAARDRQKSYADNRRKPLEFEVGDQVLLKVSPWKGVMRFGKKEKLAPR
ncbi:putative reverse transcriptase domain-containing protein [Tanacetum coccineum]